MALSNDLVQQFVKITNDEHKEVPDTTVKGTVIIRDGVKYVRLDGANSEVFTPVSSTSDIDDGDRVNVEINNHTATVVGNLSSPSARTDDLKEAANKIENFDIIMAYRISATEISSCVAIIDQLKATIADIDEMSAITAEIETLKAKFVDIDKLTVNDIVAINAEIDNIRASIGTFSAIYADTVDAANANIDSLTGYTANFTYATFENLKARDAEISNLKMAVFDAESGNIKFANIDFSNIGEAAIRKLFADTGIIGDLIVDNGTVTGEIVGVTIRGDKIIAGTIAADKIVIRGNDGILYKLNTDGLTEADIQELELDETDTETLKNSLHGSKIIANTITAEKVNVSDLVAFKATIGGFNIGNAAIYSGAKSSFDNYTDGIYLGKDGQISIGGSSSYVMFETGSSAIINSFGINEVFGSTIEDRQTYRAYLRSNGDIAVTTSIYWHTSDFLQVAAKTVIKYGELKNYYEGTNNNYPYICFYDKDKTFISGYNSTGTTNVIKDDGAVEIRTGHYSNTTGLLVPENASYFKVTVQFNDTKETPTSNFSLVYTESLGIDSKLRIKADEIFIGSGASVQNTLDSLKNDNSSVNSAIENLSNNLSNTKDDIEKSIEEIRNSVNLKMDEDSVNVNIQKAINNGIKSISTNTGYTFDDNGLSVKKSNSEMETTITDDGMAVKKSGSEVLKASSNGVDAKDLNASTYLTIGGRIRFENYKTDRIGCFWIGG